VITVIWRCRSAARRSAAVAPAIPLPMISTSVCIHNLSL